MSPENVNPENDLVSGASALWASASAAGLEICFANPGTTEMPLVEALDDHPEIRPVLSLFEGVCTGAADGYARVAGKPAATLLHLGPGFANGIANLHNARRANSAIVNIVGDQASWHRKYDAALTSDIDSLARPVSGWVHDVRARHWMAEDTTAAFAAANRSPGQVATLVVPLDFQRDLGVQQAPAELHVADRAPVPAQRIDQLAQEITGASRVTYLAGDDALTPAALAEVSRLLTRAGSQGFSETFPACAHRGQGLADLDRLPYFPEVAQKVLADSELVVLVGALDPVSYFGYEGIPGELAPPGSVRTLSIPGEDATQALTALADALGCPATVDVEARPLPDQPTGALDPAKIGAVLTRELPSDAVVSVDGGTCGYPFFTASAAAAPHRALTNTGGAIGQGLPVALGAALGAPDSRVVALQSDGAAHYTIQSLWSMAREQVDVTVLIAANNRYRVLQTELERIGAPLDTPASQRLTTLDDPTVDWASLAAGYGIECVQVRTAEELTQALRDSFATRGPRLVEMCL